MRNVLKTVGKLALVATLAVGTYALFTPGASIAGKGGGKGGNPPPCDCEEVIVLPDGTVCTLDACGFDCVYSCPLPVP